MHTVPVIEDVLFGAFPVRHCTLASIIFHPSIHESQSRALALIRHPYFDPLAIIDLCKAQTLDDISVYLNEIDPQMRQRYVALARSHPRRPYSSHLNPEEGIMESVPLAWSSETGMHTGEDYSYWLTVWLRVNGAKAMTAMLSDAKLVQQLEMFANAHISVIDYLDDVSDPKDEYLNIDQLGQLYQRLGPSRFDADRDLIQTTTQRVQVMPYPLEVIRKAYPGYHWTIEEVMPRITEDDMERIQSIGGYGHLVDLSNATLCCCLYIMVQCKDLYRDNVTPAERDALWFYHNGFLDYIYSKSTTCYPFDNRCFTGNDLPNVFPLLYTFSMWSEPATPGFPVGRFIKKSLPFAGARRGLVNQTGEAMTKDDAFWQLISSLFYCMLMDTYPTSSTLDDERCFNLKRQLEIIALVSDR